MSKYPGLIAALDGLLTEAPDLGLVIANAELQQALITAYRAGIAEGRRLQAIENAGGRVDE